MTQEQAADFTDCLVCSTLVSNAEKKCWRKQSAKNLHRRSNQRGLFADRLYADHRVTTPVKEKHWRRFSNPCQCFHLLFLCFLALRYSMNGIYSLEIHPCWNSAAAPTAKPYNEPGQENGDVPWKMHA